MRVNMDTLIPIIIRIKSKIGIELRYMSLGDLNRKVNIAGQKAFGDAHDRILRDKALHDKMLQTQAKDKLRQEVSHDKLEVGRLKNRLSQSRQELMRARSGSKDSATSALIRSHESEIRSLETQIKTMEQEIVRKNGEINKR